jgi:hypothetical protein
MTSVELNAYRLIFRNDTIKQVRQALYDIGELETAVPDELMAEIIAMVRHRGVDAVWELTWPIHKILGKTQSMALYDVAAELGYLEIDRFQTKVYTDGKVQLFVKNRFYHPDIEPLVVDELHKWLNYLDQLLEEQYADAISMIAFNGPQYDWRLKETQFFTSPLYVIDPILNALENMASAKGRELLRALEYRFGPRSNEYLMVEQKRASEGDEKAVGKPMKYDEESHRVLMEAVYLVMDTPTVYHFREILDRISVIARSEPQNETKDS